MLLSQKKTIKTKLMMSRLFGQENILFERLFEMFSKYSYQYQLIWYLFIYSITIFKYFL